MGAEASAPVGAKSSESEKPKLTFLIEMITRNNQGTLFTLKHESGQQKGNTTRKVVYYSKLIELAKNNDLLISYDRGISFKEANLTTQTMYDNTTVDSFEIPLKVGDYLGISYDLLNQRGGKLFSIKKRFKKSKQFSQKSKYLGKTNNRKKKTSYKNLEFKK